MFESQRDIKLVSVALDIITSEHSLDSAVASTFYFICVCVCVCQQGRAHEDCQDVGHGLSIPNT